MKFLKAKSQLLQTEEIETLTHSTGQAWLNVDYRGR